MKHLASLDYRVDRYNFRNHIGVACKKYNDTDKSVHLRQVNTSVMEQVNSWFGRYRHSARYMTGPRFHLYLLLACHLNNQFRKYRLSATVDNNEEEQSALSDYDMLD